MRYLVQDKRDFTGILDQITKKIAASVNTNMEKRAAAIFAIIGMAGELGIEYGLLPWDKNSALNAAIIASGNTNLYHICIPEQKGAL